MKWICLPGWATEPQLLSDLLPESAEKIEIDFNFFHDEAFPAVNEIQQHIPDEDYGIICFSMGTLFALELCKIKQPKHRRIFFFLRLR
ncbi:MAG: hypothetical protein HRT88_20420 [Lentisphaeraceae bacterium]|nr:hypothetical protein [Lentisphaeraceae bacterium]